MRRFLLLSLLSISMAATAVSLPRESIGEDTVRYSAYIETPRAAVSGICILVIRRTLRRDLRQLLLHLQQGDGTYENSRYHIKYTLTPLL